jgi:hypothetical protein
MASYLVELLIGRNLFDQRIVEASCGEDAEKEAEKLVRLENPGKMVTATSHMEVVV